MLFKEIIAVYSENPHVTYEHRESWWNDIDRGTEELGENPVPVPLYPNKSHMGANLGVRVKTLTGYLSP
jgi:hypothetical protein